MPSQREILTRINSVNTVKQMTKTMKMISVAKYNIISRIQKQSLEYIKTLNDLKSRFAQHEDNGSFNEQVGASKDLLIVISSDKGFCGNFNNNIFKKTISFLDGVDVNDLDIYAIGKKASDFLIRRGIKTHVDYADILKKININTIGEAIVNFTLNKKYNKILIIYNHFVSLTKSESSILSLDFNNVIQKRTSDEDQQFFFEPERNTFLNKLHLMYIQTQIAKAMLESCLAEHSSRMVNMNKATDNAEVLLKKQRILYNQMRQAAITNEIIEISAGYKNT